jgi:hypothetical protein
MKATKDTRQDIIFCIITATIASTLAESTAPLSPVSSDVGSSDDE